MQHSFNSITYGNLNQSQLNNLKKNCLADEVLPILEKKYSKQLEFPTNDSQTTKSELNEIVSKINILKEEENKDFIDRYNRYDKNLKQSIISVFQQKGIDVEELVLNIFADISPLIIKLKQKYQRPRPYQLAEYYKLSLFSFPTISGHSPSYPSGHTLQSFCSLRIIGNRHPSAYNFCLDLINDIAYSRVYLGVHFPSDNDASFLIGKEILKLKSITNKYQI